MVPSFPRAAHTTALWGSSSSLALRERLTPATIPGVQQHLCLRTCGGGIFCHSHEPLGKGQKTVVSELWESERVQERSTRRFLVLTSDCPQLCSFCLMLFGARFVVTFGDVILRTDKV